MAKQQKKLTKDEIEQARMRDVFRKSSAITTEELQLLSLNARDNIIGRFEQKLLNIQKVDPTAIADYIDLFQQRGVNVSSIKDIIDNIKDYFDYYNTIKTKEDLEIEFERANRIFNYQGIDIPIVIEFDFQYFGESAIFNNPTFYSYFNPDTLTIFGKGAHHIAFPSTQKYLSDEEVMVAMKHEYGHIVQGHCTIMPKDPFEVQYNNQAMDISINIGMTAHEQELLVNVARKIWKNDQAWPCMSLSRKERQGGFGIDAIVTATDWRGTSGYIRAYYDRKNKESAQGQGQGQGGSGAAGGSGQTGGTPPPPVDGKVSVGDFIKVTGTNPPIYGKVTAINEATDEISYDEYSEAEWQQIKANIKNS